MKNILKSTLTLMLMAVMVCMLVGCGGNDPDKELASVNGTPITRSAVEHYIALYNYTQGYDPGEITDEQVKDYLEGIIDNEVLRQHYESSEEDLFGGAYLESEASFISGAHSSEQDFLDNYGITDDDLKYFYKAMNINGLIYNEIVEANDAEEISAQAKAYYDEHQDDYTVDYEVRASAILLDDQETADQVKKLIDEGKDFASLASQYSQETSSAANGGDLGYFTRQDLDDRYEEKIFSLGKGEVSEIISVDGGYLIMKVTDINDSGLKSFEQVENDITYNIYQQLILDRIEELKADVEIKK